MDFSLSPKEEAFRKELCDWLDANLPEMRRRIPPGGLHEDRGVPNPKDAEFTRWWHAKLYNAGYIGIAWPKEYGGRGATLMEQVIFNTEMAERRVPTGIGGMGIGWAGPTIIHAGSEEQKKRFLPKILNGDEFWCQAFSEPEAGSDLANCQTKAVEDGDRYVVNGQKVWTTGGMQADWAILLAKTEFDPKVTRHQTFSFFLMDMHAPGVTVRPLREMSGPALFGETFLDNVRIPKNLMVGEKNKGWYIAMSTFEFERSNSSGSIRQLNTIMSLAKLAKRMKRNEEQSIRQKLAQFYIEANVGRYIGLRALTRQLRGMLPGPESAVGSILSMELSQRIADFATYLEGPYSQLIEDSKYAIDNGHWQTDFLSSRGNTLATGTSEIKRNVIAQRTLGLPR